MARADREPDVARRAIELSERELRRVLLDIHDGAVQYVYAALSQLDLLRRALVDAPPEARDRAERVRRLLEAGLGEIRGVLGATRPPAFESTELRALLEGLVLQHETTTDTRVALAYDRAAAHVAPAVRVAVYRVVQEALSNAYRHGRARGVVVSVAPTARRGMPWLRVEIRDDGDGFDTTTVVGPEHLGLAGMRDRVAMLGGTLALDSRPGGGTTLALEVPVG
ncbi:MAG: sensor histidine kinase [Gemmatirosa sp.]